MIAIGSGPIQKAMAIMTAHPVNVAVTKEETMANGTAFVAAEDSSAIVAEDSKPETTQTGVRKESMKAQPLEIFSTRAIELIRETYVFGQNPVFCTSVKTKLAEFFSSSGVPAARAMITANSIANCRKM